jgi:histidinol dehydrogenase
MMIYEVDWGSTATAEINTSNYLAPRNRNSALMSPIHLKTRAKNPVPMGQVDKAVSGVVSGVMEDIHLRGDVAVREYSEKFDKWSPEKFKLSKEEIERIIGEVDKQTIEDIKTVQKNVRRFAEAQRESLKDFELETQPGVFLGQRNNPIARVGT